MITSSGARHDVNRTSSNLRVSHVFRLVVDISLYEVRKAHCVACGGSLRYIGSMTE